MSATVFICFVMLIVACTMLCKRVEKLEDDTNILRVNGTFGANSTSNSQKKQP